jgi:predicted Zn-dependent protease
MKKLTLTLAALLCAPVLSERLNTRVEGAPASAQFGKIGDLANKAAKVKKIADVKVSDAEERQIGQQVSDKIVQDFGVYQDPAVNKYVSLVGTVLAQASARPDLDWQFVVLDTEGVNAFAAPGGFVHITKGLLGLMKNEAELAGVLAHELIHITEKHTVNAIQKGDAFSVASDEVNASGGMTGTLVSKFADAAYKNILDNKFSRNDEGEADEKGVQLANKIGYAPNGLSEALGKLAARMAGRNEPSGLMASHPIIKDRIAKIEQTIKGKKLTATATVAARYTSTIKFDAVPLDQVAMVPEGTRGLSGGEEKKEGETKPANKSGGGLGGALSKLSGGGQQAQQSQTVASAGARGVNPDRDAVGGPNKNRVKITLTPADVDAFRKGIA